MRKRDLQRERLDPIGERLIAISILTENEIENIVTSPTLYSSVLSRVNSRPAAAERTSQRLVPAFAAFTSMFLVLCFAGYFVIRHDAQLQDSALTAREPLVSETAPKLSVPNGISDAFTERDIEETPSVERPGMRVQNASFRKPAASENRPPRARVEKLPDLKFIPLVYTDDPAESFRGGRIIRVEMPRASLFAMGINVPLENGAETVKADLLVGQDGVPHGIRIPQ